MRYNHFDLYSCRLASAIVRSMKQKQQKAYNEWNSRKSKQGDLKGRESTQEVTIS